MSATEYGSMSSSEQSKPPAFRRDAENVRFDSTQRRSSQESAAIRTWLRHL
ncbi:hypothetical protein [Streptomyces misionensis]|uniref:hypothetical protein n=1 Tax=Streptomyces misionensis TaxID=67331 RepID=UPI0033B49029